MCPADAAAPPASLRARSPRGPPPEARDDAPAVPPSGGGLGSARRPPAGPASPGTPRGRRGRTAAATGAARHLLLLASSAWLACQVGVIRRLSSAGPAEPQPRRTPGGPFRPWDSVASRRRAVADGRYAGPFDLVYLWANATEEWTAARNGVLRSHGRAAGKAGPWSPTRDNDELRLSLRSVERNMPWVRNVYILSNGQRPDWADADHPRLRFVDTDDLIGRLGGAVPNFNSHAIYLASAFIEGLSEIYIQMDDDFMVGQKLPPDFFYWNYEQEATHVIDWTRRDDLTVQKTLLSRVLPGYVPRWASHTPRCWNRTRVRMIWDEHPSEVRRTVGNQLRSPLDLDLTSFYGPYVAGRHNGTLFMFRDGAIVDGTTGGTIFEIDADRNDQIVHFYGTAEEVRPNFREDRHRPLFICIQDQGGGREVTFGNLTRFLGLEVPSTFELDRGLEGPGLADEMGHRGIGLPRFDLGEVPLMENTMESIEAGRAAARLRWIEIDAGVTSDGVVIVHHF